MINKIWKSVFVVCAAGCLASCSDQMNYNEYNIFDKDYITQNFGIHDRHLQYRGL